MKSHNNDVSSPLESFGFPAGSIVGSIGDLARTLAEGTEVPEEFYFACGLTMIGSCVGDDLSLNTGLHVEPRLFTVLLGDSYSVKKSTAMRNTINFFRENIVPKNAPPKLIYGAGSAEGLARELKASPHLVLAYDEFRAMIDKCGVKGSTLLPMITSLFEGNHWHNATKNREDSVYVEEAHLSMIACCTRDTYERIWKAEAIAIGLPNRLFVVNADRKRTVALPPKPNEAQLAAIAARIREQLARVPLDLNVSDEAKQEWERWYNALPNSEHCRRLDTIGLRLLALIAFVTDKHEVDVETVHAVTAILGYELDLRALTDPIDADNKIAKLEERIRRYLAKGAMTERELRRRVHGDRDGLWAFTRALENLRTSKEIEHAGNTWKAVGEAA